MSTPSERQIASIRLGRKDAAEMAALNLYLAEIEGMTVAGWIAADEEVREHFRWRSEYESQQEAT